MHSPFTMDTSFKTRHLLLPELNYELKIRDTFTEKPVDDKRKILGRLLAKEKQQGLDVLSLTDKNFDFALEQDEIETTLTSLETLINDFEGPSTDSTFLRAVSRLNHVTNRIRRIDVQSTVVNKDQAMKFKNEAYASSLKLEADLYDRVRDPDPNIQLNSSIIDPTLNNTLRQTSVVVPSSAKSVPVYKLAIQFDGNPKNLLSFIEKVEEVAQARNVSKVNLFQSASDLFTDKATFWFRQVKANINDWDSLVAKLKKDFLASNFDDDLWNQIKTRKQGKTEPVVIYVACMEALFSRLSHNPAEITKVKYMKLGLQPEYQKRLALSDIDNVATLSTLCKRLEEADILSLASTSGSSRVCSIETELAYISDSKEKNMATKNKFNSRKDQSKKSHKNSPACNNSRHPKTSNINSVETNPQSNIINCWSCGQPNHTFRSCLASRKNKFCFKCGTQNVTSQNCPKCSGNS